MLDSRAVHADDSGWSRELAAHLSRLAATQFDVRPLCQFGLQWLCVVTNATSTEAETGGHVLDAGKDGVRG